MVIAQVPIVPRTKIEDSSRRIVQDEIEISVSGQLLLNSNSEFELAQRIRRPRAPLGELFSFISSLYFRGKLAYAKAGFPSTFVVTTSRGLLSPETVITLDDLLEMSAVSIDPGDARYREPLCQDARARWLACYRLVPRSCYSAASLAGSMSIRCLKFSAAAKEIGREFPVASQSRSPNNSESCQPHNKR